MRGLDSLGGGREGCPYGKISQVPPGISARYPPCTPRQDTEMKQDLFKS